MKGRSPAASSGDNAAIEYWAEGYLSGLAALAAGSHHDVIGGFHREASGGWLDHYRTVNPQTKLPIAINALGRVLSDLATTERSALYCTSLVMMTPSRGGRCGSFEGSDGDERWLVRIGEGVN
jgi:hypothetical protein